MSEQISFIDTPIADLKVVRRTPFTDHRGFFTRVFCNEHFWGSKGRKIEQINQSKTNRVGTVRGLHYQLAPYMETKIVTCVRGAVYDVAVDLRRSSATFLQYFAIELTSSSNQSLWIPEGFAHGFQTLEEESEIFYFSSAKYSRECERAINPLDSRIGIDWPIEVTEMSDRDRNSERLVADFGGVEVDG